MIVLSLSSSWVVSIEGIVPDIALGRIGGFFAAIDKNK
jgi:hypothetical protein